MTLSHIITCNSFLEKPPRIYYAPLLSVLQSNLDKVEFPSAASGFLYRDPHCNEGPGARSIYEINICSALQSSLYRES